MNTQSKGNYKVEVVCNGGLFERWEWKAWIGNRFGYPQQPDYRGTAMTEAGALKKADRTVAGYFAREATRRVIEVHDE